MTSYAFLDRDGTLIYEPTDTGQVDSLDRLQVLDGVIEGLQSLVKEGYRLVIVSNQDGIGTEVFPKDDFEIPHKKMLEIFRKHGVKFEAVFICPHFPADHCECRKPRTGLLDAFLEEHPVDRKRSFMCGDRDADREFAKNLGLRFVPMQTNGDFSVAMSELGK